MRTEQELRDGVLETLKCLISCQENMPGWSLDEAFNREALQDVKEEFEYLKNLWAKSCVEKKPTTTPEWSEEKKKRFLGEVSSLVDHKLEKQREEIRESLRKMGLMKKDIEK